MLKASKLIKMNQESKTENQEKELFQFGSDKLNEELESSYAKFALGVPKNIEILKNELIEKRETEFNEKPTIRYDLHIKVDDKELIWSVSKKVLTTINEFIEETTKFKIIMRAKNYDVVPLNLNS